MTEILAKSSTEIIRCKCGVVFAACVDGYQDKEWRQSRSDYLKIGFSVEFVPRDKFEFGSCDCPKSAKEIAEKTQLTLFN